MCRAKSSYLQHARHLSTPEDLSSKMPSMSNCARSYGETVAEAGESNTAHSDIPGLMAQIRERVREEVAARGNEARPFKSYSAQFDKSAKRPAGELRHSEDLYYLNTHWDYSAPPDFNRITSHRWGPVGKLIVKIKRRVVGTIWEVLLKHHVDAEREFATRLVRYLNDVSSYVDDRDASNFWELVRKIDYDVTKALTRIERIADEGEGSLRSLERSVTESMNSALKEVNNHLTQLKALAEQHQHEINTVQSVARGLEGIVARFTKTDDGASPAPLSKRPADASYLLIQNRFRGSPEQIAERVAPYAGVFRGVAGRVLDIGAGRGELVSLLNQAGIDAYGVDADRAMVEAATERGAEVMHGDGLKHLASIPDKSLGGVAAIQVVEHLTQAELQELLMLCARKVRSGGKVVLETINPCSLLALSSNYFRDPTHVRPLHPDTLSYHMTLAGLSVDGVRYLSEVPPDARLQQVPVESYMSPRWAHAVETINRNTKRINELLFGFQDYAVLAVVK